ncbi:MAG TPA: hypothetical protein VHU79_03155, partial [Sphingomicrobium sp.]|nr:hypothetical protein [Sphingomicrobium sp.]
MRAQLFFLLATIALGACSTAGGPYPSLKPRAAEATDPRIQPVRPVNDRPVSPALAAQLARLVDEARAGDTAFGPAATEAQRLAAIAGASQSESWIVAQEALSAAIAARRPTALAQADIDALGATALQTQGGIAPNDFKAIHTAAAEVLEIARGQTDRIY